MSSREHRLDVTSFDKFDFHIAKDKVMEISPNLLEVCTNELRFRIQYVPKDAEVHRTRIEQVNVRERDILLLDPPWNYMHANPTRGPHIRYSTMKTEEFCEVILPHLLHSKVSG